MTTTNLKKPNAIVKTQPTAGKKSPERVGPFMDVSGDGTRFVGDHELRFVLYGAYNAFGLIGSEHNGIAVLHEGYKSVVTDNIGNESSGYFGPTVAQVNLFNWFMTASDKEVMAAIRNSERRRMDLD